MLGWQGYHLAGSPCQEDGGPYHQAPRIYHDVADTLAREEKSAAWAFATAAAAAASAGASAAAAAAAAARAKMSAGAKSGVVIGSGGGRSSGRGVAATTRNLPPPSPPGHLEHRDREQERGRQRHVLVKDRNPRHATAAEAISFDSARTYRPALNAHRVATHTTTGLGLSRTQRGGGGHGRRRAEQYTPMPRGVGRPGRKLRAELGSGASCSPLISKPSASSHGRSTGAVEWVWPAEGVKRRPPRLSGPCNRAGFGPTASLAVSPSCRPLPASRPSLPSSFSSISYSSSSSSSSSPFSVSSSRRGSSPPGEEATPLGWVRRGGAAARDADNDAARLLYPTDVSDGRSGGSIHPQAGERAAWAAATASAAAVAAAASTVASTATSAGLALATTPTRNRGVSTSEASVQDGFGGWVGPLTSAPRPPRRSAGTGSSAERASPRASSTPSAPSRGEIPDAASEDEEDLFDLAPLPRRISACTRKGSSSMLAPGSSRGSTNGNGNDVAGVHRAAMGASGAGAEEGGGGRWWRGCIDGQGAASPVQAWPDGIEDDMSFLNPFSPASCRRFSTAATDLGARGVYGSGVGPGGARLYQTTSAASRFSSHVLHPIVDFCSEARLVGCVFGEGVDGAEHAEGVAPGQQFGRKQGEHVGAEDGGGGHRQSDKEGPDGEPKQGGERTGRASPFPLRVSSPAPYPLPGNVWPLPVAVFKDNAAAGAGDADADAATARTSTASHSPPPLSPGPFAAAGGDPEQSRDACMLSDYVNGVGTPDGPCRSPWSPRGTE